MSLRARPGGAHGAQPPQRAGEPFTLCARKTGGGPARPGDMVSRGCVFEGQRRSQKFVAIFVFHVVCELTGKYCIMLCQIITEPLRQDFLVRTPPDTQQQSWGAAMFAQGSTKSAPTP